jgi:hypothetical protein
MQALPLTRGPVLGRGRIQGWDAASKQSIEFEADVVAGPVLRSGLTNIQHAAGELIARGWHGGRRDHAGLVGFIRRGDAWDAVALLAPELPGRALKQLWSVGDLQGLRLADGVQLDAIWQISDYGYDLRFGTPETMVPARP